MEFYYPILLSAFVYLPVIGCFAVLGFGRLFGNMGCSIIAVATLTVLTLLSTFWCIRLNTNEIVELVLGNWMDTFVRVDWILIADPLSMEMCFVISFVSLCVITYSIGYMSHDPHLNRFLGYLLLFVASMLILVTSGNIVQLFLGWEGVGLASFLLISFWFTRLEAVRSSLKAVFFNRIGDMGFIAGIAVLAVEFKTLNIYDIFIILSSEEAAYELYGSCEIVGLLFFIAAMSKSAQIGLHAWLADAMEGPTPVSALLHSATMVTAGIFLLLRLTPLFNVCSKTLTFIAIIGSLTALLGATIAMFQYDIKKIIAYSTCSQLGFMVTAFGLMNASGCFFHLISHAFFKALLFLTAGSIIHALFDEQDIRKMGGLLKYMPLTYLATLVGFLGLTGFPFLSGFYSKEFVILFSLYGRSSIENFVFICILLSSACTAIYSARLMHWVFFSEYRGFRAYLNSIREPSVFMIAPILALSFLTIVFGYLFDDFFIGVGNYLWFSVFDFSLHYDNFRIVAQENAPLIIKLPLSFSFLIALYCIRKFYKFSSTQRKSITSNLRRHPNGIKYKKVFFFNYLKLSYAVIRASIMGFLGWRTNKKLGLYRNFWITYYRWHEDTKLFLYVEILPKVYFFFLEKWFFSAIYRLFYKGLMRGSYSVLIKLVDRGVLERVQTYIILLVSGGASEFKKLPGISGLFRYFLYFVFGLMFIVNIKTLVAAEIFPAVFAVFILTVDRFLKKK